MLRPPREIELALAELREGLPGRNEPSASGTGELDNGPVRHLFARAAFTVLHGANSVAAFDLLSPFFAASELQGWFGGRRALVILELLEGQVGRSLSSWLALYCYSLHFQGAIPDERWRGLLSRLPEHTGLSGLAKELLAYFDARTPCQT